MIAALSSSNILLREKYGWTKTEFGNPNVRHSI